MIHKLLIANRGEIATRVIRTAKKLGIATVAVFAEGDDQALHVFEADERVSIGAGPDAYLHVDRMIEVATGVGADGIHPGYGFLSERPDLAAACKRAGLVFVGPSPGVIAALGSKIAARTAAREAGIQVVPGTGVVATAKEAAAAANSLGFPVLVKCAQGGEGLGVKKATGPGELPDALGAIQTYSRDAFGVELVYLEKLLQPVRHVEVQIAADSRGNLVHLGVRDGSIQRRWRKILEEAPSTISAAEREHCIDAALRLCRFVGYDSLGSVEFLIHDGVTYFLEVNTRLPVEHGVTEQVTGLDLVEWQIHIALGEPLMARQDEITFDGHAIECRIYAEEVDEGFARASGRVSRFAVPTAPWVRNDIGVLEGDRITPLYETLIAKLIVHGPNRQSAIDRLQHALHGYVVDGVSTNLGVHQAIASHPEFLAGNYDTEFLASALGKRS